MVSKDPFTLSGRHVSLVPLAEIHCVELQAAVRDGALWKLPYTIVPSPENMFSEINRRLDLQAQGLMQAFAVIDHQSNRAVGMTSYCRIDAPNRRLDIGWTWYRRSMQRTAVNTECKLLLLAHAFEQLNCIAVGFRVHSLNEPSRRAVERLGAQLDGIIRNDSIMPDGRLRNMCFYSILPEEWLAVKAKLRSFLL